MTILDRFNIGLVGAVAGLCGVAMAASPVAAAVPFATGGYECVAPAAGGAAPAAGGAVCAPETGAMGGVPMGLPGPPPPIAPPPVVPPIAPPPIVPPLAPPPIVPPIVPAAAPLAPAVGGMGGLEGGYGGKGDLILPPAAGAPAPGQPILPGPAARGAS